MRIGIRGHDMEKVPFEELVSNINKKGFKCTQLALSKAITEFNVKEEAMTPGMALYMRQVFAENKVDVAVLGCYLNLSTTDKELLAKTTKTYEAHIRFASLLGCGVVGTETCCVNDDEATNHSEEALEALIRNLRPVVEYAEKMGVIIAIEPVWKHVVCDAKRARRVLDEINSPNLQIIFDPVNMISIHNYEKQDELINEVFDLLHDEIAIIHSKDFIVENGEIKSVVSGKGLLNYDLLMSHIKKYKPFIHVLLEDTKPENAIETREFVERKYAEA